MTYTSHADLGGQPGHGPVQREPEGELWHAPWEPRAMALTLAMGATGAWNLDASRAAREALPTYDRLTYYEIWVAALQSLLRQRGMLNDAELTEGHSAGPGPAVPRVLRAADVDAALAQGSPAARPMTILPRHAIGDRVRLRVEAVAHHTRLPGYVRGKCGTVQALHGAHIFPDSHAQGLGEQPSWLYTVVFSGPELWGEGAESQRLTVSVDAWEPYMEPA